MELDLKLEKLIKQEVKYESTNLSLNLIISRLQRKYSSNPSQAELNNCLQEMKVFLKKYDSLVGKDIEALKNL